MAQMLYDFLNWQYSGVLLIIWVVVDIMWISRWKDLFSRIGMLISKPLVFKKDENPENTP